jgi:hypothetical protein
LIKNMLSRLSSFSGPLSKLFTAIKGFTLDGLILRYEISDSDSYSGTSSITDLVANSNATLLNDLTYSINGYLNLDGVNDYVMTNTSLNSKLSSTILSHFVWIYPQDDGVIITEQGSSSLNTSWHAAHIEMVSGTLRFGLWVAPGSISSLVSSISTPLNRWYYVGLTYDGTTMRTYINGQSAGTKLLTRAKPAELYFGIGATDFTNMGDGSYAKMKLGAFHVYNKSLSNQEIVSNYNYTKSNYIYTGSMSIWIDANDPQSFSGGSIFDISGNNYTHSLTSGATLSTIFGFNSFDCATASQRVVVDGTGPTLSTSGYTYVVWARLGSDDSSFRTLLYTKSPRYTPITIPNVTHPDANKLGYWDTNSRSSSYDISSLVGVWVQYSVVGDNSSQTFYINDYQVGNSISYGAGGTLHDGLGNNLGASQSFGYVGNMMLYDKKLSLAEIKQNYDALKHVYADGNFVTSNLILYFNPASKLSYPTTGATISNLVSNSLNGTMSNVTFTNPYLSFNGSNSTISVTDNSSLEPNTGDFTVEIWVNYSVISGSSRVLIGKTDGGNSVDWGYGIRTVSNGNTYIEIGSGSGSTITSPVYAVTTNTWYQLVGVINNTSNLVSLYVNGSLIGSNVNNLTSIRNTTSPLYIGSFNNGQFSQWFNGKMGIVRIYNSALSSSDVSKNFEANRNIYGI